MWGKIFIVQGPFFSSSQVQPRARPGTQPQPPQLSWNFLQPERDPHVQWPDNHSKPGTEQPLPWGHWCPGTKRMLHPGADGRYEGFIFIRFHDSRVILVDSGCDNSESQTITGSLGRGNTQTRLDVNPFLNWCSGNTGKCSPWQGHREHSLWGLTWYWEILTQCDLIIKTLSSWIESLLWYLLDTLIVDPIAHTHLPLDIYYLKLDECHTMPVLTTLNYDIENNM